LGADCSMQDNEQGKAVFKGVDLLSEHVIGHVNDGYQVITIGVCWDSNYFMSLNNDLRISKIKATDELSEAISNDNDDPLVRLDTDTARLSLEFQRLWQDLTTAFGGESKAATQTA
ncbi:recombination-associated protein RdgC, partial [Neptunomonas phycophila]